MSKSKLSWNVFDVADRLVSAFFRRLEKNTADQVVKKAKQAKLPPHATKLMKDIEDRGEELRRILKEF
jgi:hypothetical protein